MQTLFSDLSQAVREVGGTRIAGQVRAISGLTLTVEGLGRALGIGQRCLVHGRNGPVLAEVVGLDDEGAHVLPFGVWRGIAAGDAVEVLEGDDLVRPTEAWLGRVIDGLARPLDGRGRLPQGGVPRSVHADPPNAFDRRRVGPRMDTGIKAVDIFTPICRGQRMGVFAGSGVGKSTLMAMLARQADADVIVIGLVGERGREVQDFVQKDLGPDGLARSVLVVSTGDEPPLMRRQAAWTATAVAEHFRDAGFQVLLLIDSVTRFAMAQREIGLAAGEPPAQRGFPPTTFAELPQLLERAGPGRDGQGDITAIYTVLVEGEDMNDPVADSVRGILDGHVILDRTIAERGRYPAIDLLRSISRMLPECHGPEENALLREMRLGLARFEDMEDLIRLGAYKEGSDPEVDRATRLAERLHRFLTQSREEATTTEDAFAGVKRLLLEAGIEIDGKGPDAEAAGPVAALSEGPLPPGFRQPG
ncbi:flagellar protein export ATPase FliI [Roseibacterium sp. SDUM158016]|uniref:flagellar protein export ATPase FliI n=1 Tax=Roseicyclus sediminis TaxID=2980997 RepID=UPI0021D0CB14|nr:flagellar protein export ATPase FliI [Roseibacterium sp. SDUM158016]MCU4654307.1 flagellar protein export ATPase FliI [Roseibacterium sp. SDUM158016]